MLCMNVSSSESQAVERVTVLGASTSQKRVHGVEDAMELDVATPSSPRGSKRKADTGGAPSAKRSKRAHDDGHAPPTSTLVMCKTALQPEPVARPSASTSVATTSTRLLALELSRLRRQVRIPILKAHSPLQHEVLPHYHTFAHWQQSLSKRRARDPGSPESPLEDTEEATGLFPIFERQDTPAAEDGDEWDEFAREFERDLMQIGGGDDSDLLLSEPGPTRMILECDEELDYGEHEPEPEDEESSEDEAPLLSRTARPSWRTSDEQDGESDCESEEETPVTPPANHSRASSSSVNVDVHVGYAQPTTSFLRGEPQPESFFDASASEEEEEWDDCVDVRNTPSHPDSDSSPPPSNFRATAPQSESSHVLRTAKTFIAFTAPVRKFTMSLISARNLARMLQKDAPAARTVGVPEPVCAVWRDRCAAARQ
ncbi:hypothetical protein EXIGLDRAFT_722079 [Exidia glandulosa HHB12029]|uniref:Uncharacterized protein n=1 Tax=Exidia glandulosa HHB12029 TaxID=1314781 RepID=A0A165FGX9_EXIGL|nr:hypothetical protein EXIGLDRAFT_722079 [Exidia glandulosa HHB12029]